MRRRLYRLQRARLSAAPLSVKPAPGVTGRLLQLTTLVGVLSVAVVAGVWWGYQNGARQESERLGQAARASLANASALAQVSLQLAEKTQQLQMADAARTALAGDLSSAQQELASSRERLAFFETLLTANDRAHQVSFASCEFEPGEQNKWHYRLTVVQGVDRAPEFDGVLNISATSKARPARIEFAQQTVRIKHYQRIEGDVTVPDGARPELFEATLGVKDARTTLAQCQKKAGGI
ncbi:hypothetical protein GCM10010970_21570 [Silvimonas iriomotensis]|uniref:Uncharacterized protein n=1 Tax=Silvimonas iriomotensis TaxID=449662 RepID=A0ABQ2P9P4_9NEIS|nr:hypothetical protein GCM10010970_21570 [Silvimonas iriomotensis]